jgi:hypothetical protein
VRRHEAHLEWQVEAQQAEEERRDEAGRVVARRAANAHSKALQRGREARAEVEGLKEALAAKGAQLGAMAADERIDELCARLAAGDTRARQIQQELDALRTRAEDDAKEAARKHAVVELALARTEAALEAYRSFQTMEGGAYKDSVRLCYYSLIDKKVPTNQIEAVVADARVWV